MSLSLISTHGHYTDIVVDLGKEKYWYLGGGALLILGAVLVTLDLPVILSYLSLAVGVVSEGVGLYKRQQRVSVNKELLDELINEKSRLRDDLESKEEKLEEVAEERARKSQRLQNLKQVLDREGIDTEYLVEEYGKPLKAVLIVITHTRRNDEKEYIKKRIESLGGESIHGATKLIPPSSVDQDISNSDELVEWFQETVLEGKDLQYKLELLTLLDVKQLYGEDKTEGDTYYEVVDDLFDLDSLIPSVDIIDILAHSSRFSLQDELRKNVALLAVTSASQEQLEAIISSQPSIQNALGPITQIANTDVDDIESVLQDADVPDAGELAPSLRQEARRIELILDEDNISFDVPIPEQKATQ